MHIDILNQFIFRENGPNVGAEDIKDAWVYYGVSDLGGGVDAKRLMVWVRRPLYRAVHLYQCGVLHTESWIENETIGAIFPYMPRQAEAYADIFTTVQGDSYATYLGKLCARHDLFGLRIRRYERGARHRLFADGALQRGL